MLSRIMSAMIIMALSICCCIRAAQKGLLIKGDVRAVVHDALEHKDDAGAATHYPIKKLSQQEFDRRSKENKKHIDKLQQYSKQKYSNGDRCPEEGCKDKKYRALREHLKGRHSLYALYACACGEAFNQRNSLRGHLTNMGKKNSKMVNHELQELYPVRSRVRNSMVSITETLSTLDAAGIKHAAMNDRSCVCQCGKEYGCPRSLRRHITQSGIPDIQKDRGVKVTLEKATAIIANFKLGDPDREQYVCGICYVLYKRYKALRDHCSHKKHPVADVYLAVRKGMNMRRQIRLDDNSEEKNHSPKVAHSGEQRSVDFSLAHEDILPNQPRAPLDLLPPSVYHEEDFLVAHEQGEESPANEDIDSFFNQDVLGAFADEQDEQADFVPNNQRLALITPAQTAQAVAAAAMGAMHMQRQD